MSTTGIITRFQSLVTASHDDDSTDRLNYYYTAYMLLGLSLTLFAKNYVGEPLQCWAPAQWKDHWEDYAESYCFVENTYFVNVNDSLPHVSQREDKEMIYYQWVPFILALQALCFFLPRGVWKIFSHYSGLSLTELMKNARNEAKTKPTGERVVSRQFAYNIQRETHSNSLLRFGSYLSNLFILKKVLILINIGVQFWWLNFLLGPRYRLWGFGILVDMINGRQWQESGHFPRVTFCDVTVRAMGQVNNWTVQCVLMVNMFNEKIFLFIWWWFLFVLALTALNLLIWVYRRFNMNGALDFVEDLLRVNGVKAEPKDLSKFYEKILKEDGVLVLRLLSEGAGNFNAADVTKILWDACEDTTDSDGAKSDGTNSDEAKSDDGKSDGGKSDGGKSEGGKSEGTNSDELDEQREGGTAGALVPTKKRI